MLDSIAVVSCPATDLGVPIPLAGPLGVGGDVPIDSSNNYSQKSIVSLGSWAPGGYSLSLLSNFNNARGHDNNMSTTSAVPTGRKRLRSHSFPCSPPKRSTLDNPTTNFLSTGRSEVGTLNLLVRPSLATSPLPVSTQSSSSLDICPTSSRLPAQTSLLPRIEEGSDWL